MQVGFLIDRLTALMMVVVTFVSLCVHVYTIGYMHDDPGYQRFFSYISLFTFSMLMLVMSNNFMQLFFGWEAVGVVSYLLIGFWYTRPSGDLRQPQGVPGQPRRRLRLRARHRRRRLLHRLARLRDAFAAAPQIARRDIPLSRPGGVDALTLICICLFIGAMGKSAQVPLHVWLPDSMEGPTPISALIHAATMVTAGIFMVARMSPLFEQSEAALSFVLVIGATTAFFMGLLGIVNNDIKRVIAYSTLSQLGYMTVALGVSAYGAAIFHLMTHAFFKALLFLAAGSVIIGMHHEQDMRKMGGLRKYMPITAVTSLDRRAGADRHAVLLGLLFQGRDHRGGGRVAPLGRDLRLLVRAVGVFVTALYTFRMLFLTFHGPERFRTAHARTSEQHGADRRAAAQDAAGADAHAMAHGHVQPHESPRGGHGAADRAGDSVGRSSAASPSGRCCSAATSAARSSCCPATTSIGEMARGIPRAPRARAARLLSRAVLARARRRASPPGSSS